MDKKIDLNNLIKKMNDTFPDENSSELERARFLYIELGKLLKFDINYVSSSDLKSEDIYWKEVDFDNIESNEYICRQISDMYAELLRRADVNAEPVWQPELGDDDDFDPTCRHKFVVIKLKDGRNFIADLVYDMPFIQKGLKTMFFGEQENELLEYVSKIDQQEVEDIDQKNGYKVPKDADKTSFSYIDEFIKMVRDDIYVEDHLRDYVSINFSEEEANNIKQNSLIKYKLDIISRFFTVSEMGFREGRMFLEKIFLDFFTEEEKKAVKGYNLITEHETFDGMGRHVGNTDMLKCFVWDKGDKSYEYYIYEQGKNLRHMTKEELKALMKKEGFKDYSSYSKVPGLDDEDDAR